MTKNLIGIFALFLCLTVCQSIEHESEIKVIESYDQQRLAANHKASDEINKKVENAFESLKGLFNDAVKPLSSEKRSQNAWIGGSEQTYALSQKTKLILTAYKQLQNPVQSLVPGNDYDNNYLDSKMPAPFCPKLPNITCDEKYIYRSQDGSCNNLDKPWWGQSETPVKRLLASEYDDYVTEPRVRSVIPKKYLPNARRVALNLFQAQPTVSEWTEFMTYFGQFVDHDLTLTAQSSYRDGNRKICKCNSYDPDCYNIPIPAGDYANKDQTCMSFVRSLASVRDFDCSLGPREQINLQTHWADLSQVYGPDDSTSISLRLFKYGLLQSRLDENKKELLPFDENVTCNYNRYWTDYSRRNLCFKAGDKRAEDNSILTSFHTLWVREHNRVARELVNINPCWEDETVYQEARRIVTAVYQNIVFGEYLPALLGESVSRLYGLLPLETGYFDGYRDNLYPQIINEFATAAFRYGHTFVTYSRQSATYSYQLSDAKPVSFYQFNNLYYNQDMAGMLRGLLMDWSYAPTTQTNKYLGDWLWDGLFSYTSRRWSLPALNVQRGRDHGIPGYNKYRQLCGLNYANTFEEFDNIPPYVVSRLKSTYASPHDVDLFTGLFSEYPVEGGMLGATASCIIAKQFHDLKYGDRFYYETSNDILKFTEDQLKSIRSQSIGNILCNNIDVPFVQKYGFFVANRDWNQLIDCKNLPALNLTLWNVNSGSEETCSSNVKLPEAPLNTASEYYNKNSYGYGSTNGSYTGSYSSNQTNYDSATTQYPNTVTPQYVYSETTQYPNTAIP